VIKVVALDLDGTLLRSDGTVSQATVEALAGVAAAAMRAVIVTARPPRFVKRLAAEAGLTGLAICSNGAIVYDLDRDHSTICGPLQVSTARSAALAVAAVLPDAAFAVETGWQAVAGPAYGHRASGEDSRVDVPSEEELWSCAETCVKLLAWSPAQVTDALLELVAGALPADTTVTYSGASGMLEIHAAGVSKVATLSRLCLEWGVTAAEVAAFGDMPNDLPVMGWAGLAVAVANAHPSVKAIAHEVTASNDDDGVATVLSRWGCDVPAR
jgi:Cof subfamily protein (haloacid dehalogenase superfamily)